MFKKIILVIVAACILIPSAAFASGFAINEQGAKALGMGGAFAAQADDPTAAYFNPAGITQLEGTQVSTGVSLIKPKTEFKGKFLGQETSSKTDDITFIVPNLNLTTKINDKLSLGVAVFSNFGLGMDWQDDWAGSYLIGGRKAEIKTYSFNPSLAYKVNNNLSVAGGVVVQRVEADIRSTVPIGISPTPTGAGRELKLDGDSDAVGFNLGLHYKLDNWRLGASYRSEMRHTVKGDSKIKGVSYPGLTGDLKVDLNLPAVTYLGVAWVGQKWTFEFDGQYTEWSSYNKLDPKGLSVIGVKPKNWKDVWALRFGTQYQLNNVVALRAGIIRDFSPIKDEYVDAMLPSGDRWLYSVGAGFKVNDFIVIDVAYNYLDDEDRKFNNETGNVVKGNNATRVTGKFQDTDAHIIATNVTFKF